VRFVGNAFGRLRRKPRQKFPGFLQQNYSATKAFASVTWINFEKSHADTCLNTDERERRNAWI